MTISAVRLTKVALMALLAVIVTESGLSVPLASPLQPVKMKFALAGVAVSVTTASGA